MAKANRGKLDSGLAYQQLRDPHGQHYSVTTPAELHNLLNQGYSLPEGTDVDDAAAHLAPNVGGEPAASTAAAGSGASSGGAAATASAGGGSGTSSSSTASAT